ncbi:hypothetical protein GQX73_g4309 [Xylaria multiplex]|uniref:C2H2-type domain-containing protein n=1 Tax=Xylaria multiplex TaxID=323545 RepID=A0A7C8J297_9PEZI|nr:hypothetical protein GQX73_g4309 [Xylaria multiplex]
MATYPKFQDISSQARECKSLFTRYLEPSASPRAFHEKVQSAERRFLNWAEFLRVFADEEICLDRRLQYQPDVKDLVMSMLQVLRRNLEHNMSGTTLVGDASLYGITGAIDRLERLRVMITLPPLTDEIHHVREFAKRQAPDDFYDVTLMEMKFLFPEAEESLRVQLARSIVYRRHRILWIRMASKKLGHQRVEKEDQPFKEEEKPAHAGNIHQRSTLGTETESSLSSTQHIQRQLGHRGDVIFSAIKEEDNSGPRPSGCPPISQYPKRPLVKYGEQKVMCQYCLREVEMPPTATEEMMDVLWRNHIDEDLRPYACISNDCVAHPVSFSTVEEWKTHMNDTHPTNWTQYIHRVTWRCQYCDNSFLVEELLKFHLTQNHSKNHEVPLDSFELDIITLRSKFKRPRNPDECPLCGPAPWSDPRGQLLTPPGTMLSDLEMHLAAHLQHVAFLSLSRWETDSRETDIVEVNMYETAKGSRDLARLRPNKEGSQGPDGTKKLNIESKMDKLHISEDVQDPAGLK